jgi:hypothetical protein
VNVGIVGHEAAKFGSSAEAAAKLVIRELLAPADAVLVSGHCHLGGIDIWAEEIAIETGRYDPKLIHPPATTAWENGYKPRNLLIARDSDVVHCLVVDRLPPTWTGMRFPLCYHCGTKDHVKSGGCWTAKRGKVGMWHIIQQDAA